MRHTLDPVFDIFPKWRSLLHSGAADDGSPFDALEVPAPSGSDAAAGLLVRAANGAITVGFDVYHAHFDGWGGDAGALELIRHIVMERVAVVSWWSGGRWCGSAPLEAGQRPAIPSWATSERVDRIRVRSWRGALNADVECGRAPSAP